MNSKVTHINVGNLAENCWFLANEDTKEAVVIDPGAEPDRICAAAEKHGWKITAILLTHGHFDHMMAADELRRTFQIPIYAGEKEVELLADPDMNVSKLGGECVSLNVDRLLRDGETLDFLGEEWKVLFTPGHTGGGVCYYLKEQKILFSGDTLFDQSVGRTDLPTGSGMAIIDSVTRVLFALPDEVMVYPGHGDETSIGYEKLHNPVAHYAGR